MDNQDVNVDVFAMEHVGPFEHELPSCNILCSNILIEALIGRFCDLKGKMKVLGFVVKLCRKILDLFGFDLVRWIFSFEARSNFSGIYDEVIAFSEGAPTLFVSYVETVKRIAWVQCDYQRYLRLNGNPDEEKVYKLFDAIICVSEYTCHVFCSVYPSVAPVTHAIHNIIDLNEIYKLARIDMNDREFSNEVFTILSVGRIDSVKRFSRIPEVARMLWDRGCRFRWYILGNKEDTMEFDLLLRNIERYSVSEFVVPLGGRTNPYPYFLRSNLVVCLSTSEACPNAVLEAKILQIPVVCSDFGSASEFVLDGYDGYIVPIERLCEKIEIMIKNQELYNQIKGNLLHYQYGNDIVLSQLVDVLA